MSADRPEIAPLHHGPHKVVGPRSCDTCAWFSDNSECRRWPPSSSLGRNSTYGRWPLVATDDWCGEWRLGAEAGEIEAMMRAVAIMDGPEDFETYTDKGRRALKGMAIMWLSAMRQAGLVPIMAPRADDA